MQHKQMRIFARIFTIFYLFYIFSVTLIAAASPSISPDTQVQRELETQVEITKKLNNEPVQFSELNYNVYYDINLSTEHLILIQDSIKQLELYISSNEYTKEAVLIMNQELLRLQDIVYRLETDIQKYTAWESEYYYATKTWEYLKQRGYNDAVVSGIIGNMMIECGGHTLNLNPFAYNPTGKYYGLCQWNSGYGLHGASFEKQLEFLVSNIEREFNVFGKCYQAGFNYEAFISMSNPANAALAFAKSYERCGSGSYSLRKQAAQEAYNYFNLDK